MKDKIIYFLIVPLFVILGAQNILLIGKYGLYTNCLIKFFKFKNTPHFLKTDFIVNPFARILVSICIGILLIYFFIIFIYNFIIKKKPNGAILLFISIMLIVFEVIIPTGFIAGKRMLSTDKHHLTHDGGVIQTEIATNLILQGKNPYGYNYIKTPMADSFHIEKIKGKGKRLDPDYTALYHYPYFPGSFIVSIPFNIIISKIFGFYDQRILYIFLYLLMIIFIYRIFPEEYKNISPIIIGLLPLFTNYLIIGTNDIFYISFIVFSFYCIKKGHNILSFVFLALACTIKQFAFLLLPFFLIYYIKNKIQFIQGLIAFIIILSIFILPFYYWNSNAFIDDTINHSSGYSKTPYPLGGTPGYGFSNFILTFSNIKSRYEYFPFIYFSIISFTVIFILSIFIKPFGVSHIIYTFSISFFLFLYFARMLHINYLSSIIFLFFVAVFTEENS